MRLLSKTLLSVATIFGIANASTNVGNQKIALVSQIDDNTQLILEDAIEYAQNTKQQENMLLAFHYSHYSHSSHYSSYDDDY